MLDWFNGEIVEVEHIKARLVNNVLAVDLGGSVLQPTAVGVVKATAEHNTLDVIGQQRLNVAAHVVAIRLVRLRANVKGCDTLVAVRLKLGLDTLYLVFASWRGRPLIGIEM